MKDMMQLQKDHKEVEVSTFADDGPFAAVGSFQTVINRHGFHSALRKTDDGWRVWKLEQRDN